MKKLLILFSTILLLCSCSWKDSGNIRSEKYDRIVESSKNNTNNAVVIWKYVERKDRANEFFVKRNSKISVETINRIDYTFWFIVVRENSKDTVWMSVPLDMYQQYEIGDRL